MQSELLNPEVQEYISMHLHADINRLLFKKSPFSGISSMELVQQIDGKRRIEKKLPLWFNTPGIYYPPKLNLEQSSSELTAHYKSKLIKGNTVVDLTGGFGVDTYYFSKKARHVTHLERNSELSSIAAHNASVLKAGNIEFVVGDSMEFLKSTAQLFDTIYLDPARRANSRKVFMLEDTEPNVIGHLDLLQKKTARILIKTSPLFDIQSGLRELNSVSEVHVVSVKNDCKELLWVIDKDYDSEAQIVCAGLTNDREHLFRFKLSEEKKIQLDDYSSPLNFVYEPDVALLKAGCFKSLSRFYHLKKLAPNTHLYTSEELNTDFLGRIFKVKLCMTYKDFRKSSPVQKANVISRNFPLSADEIRKKHKIQDGGDDFLIFCSTAENELICMVCQRL